MKTVSPAMEETTPGTDMVTAPLVLVVAEAVDLADDTVAALDAETEEAAAVDTLTMDVAALVAAATVAALVVAAAVLPPLI